jgi:hypothetical protein
MTFAAAYLYTTLVLEPATADFSTDAGNSALIVATKSPRCLLAPITACPAAKKKNNKRDFHRIRFTREGTQCHEGSSLADNL